MATRSNANLAVRVGADTTDLKKGMEGASASLKKFGKVSLGIGKAVATGMLAATAAIGAMAIKAVKAADSIAKTADKVGLSTTKLQEYRFAAEKAGIETRSFDLGMQRFNKRLGEAAMGMGPMKKSLDTLGISVKDAKGNIRDTNEVFLEFSDKLGAVESDSQRAALAFSAFDDSGAAMSQMLRGGSAALNDAANEAQRLGIVLDEKVLRNSEKVNDEITAVSKVLKVQFQAILLELLPFISQVAAKILELAGGFKMLTTDVKTFLGVGITQEMNALNKEAKGLYKEMEHINDVADEFASGKLSKETIKMAESLGVEWGWRKEISDLTEEQRIAVTRMLAQEQIARQETYTAAIANVQALTAAETELLKVEQTRRDENSLTGGAMTVDPSIADDAAKEAYDKAKANADRLTAMYQTQAERQLAIYYEAKKLFDEGLLSEDTLSRIEKQFGDELEVTVQAHTRKYDFEKMMLDKMTDDQRAAYEERKRFTELSTAAQTQFVLGSLAQLTAGTAQHSKKMFKLNKAAGIANAIVSTYVGVTKTLEAYPFPISAVMAAAQLAAGLAQVQAIKNSKFEGGGAGTTPSLAGSTPTVNSQPASQQISISGFRNDVSYSGAQIRELIGAINQGIRDGATLEVQGT